MEDKPPPLWPGTATTPITGGETRRYRHLESGKAEWNPVSQSMDIYELKKLLATLYEQDRTEHAEVPAVGSEEYRRLRSRDADRRAEAKKALALLRQMSAVAADDLFHAAWLFNHGDSPGEAHQAHEWAREAVDQGSTRARWLAAAAYDRWMMYEGRAQKYGTQFVPDGRRYRLWDVDPATTDEMRAEWDVPPLQTQLERADTMSRDLPQPPMGEAPYWLRKAIQRWADEAGESPTD